MKAIILCAGLGKRMEPYTETYQKTMIPLHGKPILEYIIENIKKAGINEFILVIGYRKEQVIDYFKEGYDWGVSIEYIEQKQLNGTGGAVILCEELIKEKHFFLTWGDTLVSHKVYKQLIKIHLEEKTDYNLVGNVVEDPYKGAAIYCKGHYCKEIIEKPPKGTSTTNLNNAGIFIFSNKIFDVLKSLKPSKRGEIEIPEAIHFGIKKLSWKFRVLKMTRDDFYADFGNRDQFEELKKDTNWLAML
jgi:dTDP-glucose pyrophosphorylase